MKPWLFLLMLPLIPALLTRAHATAAHEVHFNLVLKNGESAAGKEVFIGGYHYGRNATVEQAYKKSTDAQGQAHWKFRDDWDWRTDGWCVKIDGPYYCVDYSENFLTLYYKDAKNNGRLPSGDGLPLRCKFSRNSDEYQETWQAECSKNSY